MRIGNIYIDSINVGGFAVIWISKDEVKFFLRQRPFEAVFIASGYILQDEGIYLSSANCRRYSDDKPLSELITAEAALAESN